MAAYITTCTAFEAARLDLTTRTWSRVWQNLGAKNKVLSWIHWMFKHNVPKLWQIQTLLFETKLKWDVVATLIFMLLKLLWQPLWPLRDLRAAAAVGCWEGECLLHYAGLEQLPLLHAARSCCCSCSCRAALPRAGGQGALQQNVFHFG